MVRKRRPVEQPTKGGETGWALWVEGGKGKNFLKRRRRRKKAGSKIGCYKYPVEAGRQGEGKKGKTRGTERKPDHLLEKTNTLRNGVGNFLRKLKDWSLGRRKSMQDGRKNYIGGRVEIYVKKAG